jgi:hypothetical protein
MIGDVAGEPQSSKAARRGPPAAKAAQRGPRIFDVEDIEARGRYGSLLIRAYVALLAALVILPVLVWALVSSFGDPAAFRGGLHELQNFVVALLAGLSGLSGLAGLVVGRHFSQKRP